MPATQQRIKLMPPIYKKNISRGQIRRLIYKPTLLLHGGNISERKSIKPVQAFSSMGLAIPFQPCMWDEKTIQSVWDNATEMVRSKLRNRYSQSCSGEILKRLEKIFSRLNFNTHRKSLAVLLTPSEEKVIYLSFQVKPVVFFSKSASLFDLTATVKQEPDFYYFIFNDENVSLYEYNNRQLRKAYEQNNEACPVNLVKSASNTIELLNSKNEKPVFVTGRPNIVERFCNSTSYSKQFFTLLYHASPFSTEIIQSLVKEITVHWNYWQSKFIKGKILIAQKAGSLISNMDAVLKALGKCADGLLLVDKHLEQQLQKSSMASGLFQLANEFMQQLEKFLVRGNRFEITETGLLKEMGGIVLLQGNNKDLQNYRHSTAGGSLY